MQIVDALLVEVLGGRRQECWGGRGLKLRQVGRGGSGGGGRPPLNCEWEWRWRVWGRRANWMFVANAMRGSGKKVGPGDGPKHKAPGLDQCGSRSREGEFNYS